VTDIARIPAINVEPTWCCYNHPCEGQANKLSLFDTNGVYISPLADLTTSKFEI